MRLCVKSLALAASLLWGGMFFLVALFHQLSGSDYGSVLLEFGASIYPGYHGAGGFGSVIVVTLYALLDGAIGGAVLAGLYNQFNRTLATGTS